ncbi:MAG: hypothetical protein ACM3IK_08810 [Sphingomonadaceae bacterium]
MKLRPPRTVSAVIATSFAVSSATAAGDRAFLPNMLPVPNATGMAATYSSAGTIDTTGPFFQSLGTNGRSCVTCHQPREGWTVTPQGIRKRFQATQGTDPIFRTNDGANSPRADVSTLAARREAYSMLLDKGLVRIGIGVPANAEFELVAVDDPYGYASSAELSLFRRVLPSTNLKFLSTVMWDGRETFLDPTSRDCILGTARCFAPLHFDLAHQANGATTGHAEAAEPLSPEQREAIVAFESALFTAQIFDDEAGDLAARGAKGGPYELTRQEFYFGINDVVSNDYRTGAPFDPNVFKLYAAWDQLGHDVPDEDGHDRSQARAAVARGERLFNGKPLAVASVKGLNDDLGIPVLQGTCTTCHDTPAAGDHSTPVPLDIGIADASRRTPDMPLYTLRQKAAPFATIQTTDPGRALITGKWADIGRFKGPILRGLATRAPYFHNGSAADLRAVVDFYDERFGIGLTEDERDDLVAFLRTL